MASDRGDFALDPRGRPTQWEKVNGRLVPRHVTASHQSDDDEEVIDGYMRGVTGRDLRGPTTGLAKVFAGSGLSAGSNPGVNENGLRRHDSYDNEGQSDDPPDTEEDEIENPADYDLFDVPPTHPKPDYRDRIESSVHRSADGQDEEDFWSLENYEPFTEDRRNEDPAIDDPTFTGKPHRQTEASMDADLDEALDDLFGA